MGLPVFAHGAMQHVWDRHFINAYNDPGAGQFDMNFINAEGGILNVARVVEVSGDSLRRGIVNGYNSFEFYYNFGIRTGTGVDAEGNAVFFQGVRMFGYFIGDDFHITTIYPAGGKVVIHADKGSKNISPSKNNDDKSDKNDGNNIGFVNDRGFVGPIS